MKTLNKNDTCLVLGYILGPDSQYDHQSDPPLKDQYGHPYPDLTDFFYTAQPGEQLHIQHSLGLPEDKLGADRELPWGDATSGRNMAPDGSYLFKESHLAPGESLFTDTWHYYNKSENVIFTAVAGTQFMTVTSNANSLHQAVGTNPDTFTAFFTNEKSHNNWQTTDLVNLLKWPSKPAGAKDDYDKFNRQIRYLTPVGISEVEEKSRTSAVPLVEGLEAHTPLPSTIYATAQVLVDKPDDSATDQTDDWEDRTVILTLNTSSDRSNQWRYQLSSIRYDKGKTMSIRSVTRGGAIAGIATDIASDDLLAAAGGGPDGAIPKPNGGPAIAIPIFFQARNIYGGFDPPIPGDKHKATDQFDQEDQHWKTALGFQTPSSRAKLLNLETTNPGMHTSVTKWLKLEESGGKGISFLPPPAAATQYCVTRPTPSGDASYDNISVNGKDIPSYPGNSLTAVNAILKGEGNFFELSYRHDPWPDHDPSGLVVRGQAVVEIREQFAQGAGKNLIAKLEVDALPIRVVPIGFWYLEDNSPNTDDVPNEEFRNAQSLLDHLNEAFWQAKIVFVPTTLDENNNPCFKQLQMDYGETNVVNGKPERQLDLKDDSRLSTVRNGLKTRLNGEANSAKLNLIAFRNSTSNCKDFFGITKDPEIDTAFIQSGAFESEIQPGREPNGLWGKNTIIDDYYVTFTHELGHCLEMSTKTYPAQQAGEKWHDMGDGPLFHYSMSGLWLERRNWNFHADPNEREVATKTICVPWATGEVVFPDGKMKRRLYCPLMRSAHGTSPGSSSLSFWLRHEDWERASDKAPFYE